MHKWAGRVNKTSLTSDHIEASKHQDNSNTYQFQLTQQYFSTTQQKNDPNNYF